VRHERGDRRPQLRHVVRAIRVAWRRHPDEVDGGEIRRLGEIGGEAQPPGRDALGQHRVKIGLVEPAFTRVEQAYLALIDVHPDDLVPKRGHTRGMRGPKVPAADHRHLHWNAPMMNLDAPYWQKMTLACWQRLCCPYRRVMR
jgi:hypothetical protein